MPRLPVLLAASLLVPLAPAVALPPVVVERHVLLSVEALIVDGTTTKKEPSPVALEIGPDSEEKASLYLPWRPGGIRASVRLAARQIPGPAHGPPSVRCAATVEVPGAPPRTSERIIDGEGTSLFEVLDDGERRIVLALAAEPVDRPVVRRLAKVGEPVRFLVAVERVDGDRSILLETNRLNTFVGQSVSYSFRLGRDAALQDVRLDLLPLSVTGDIVTIETAVTGALPGTGGTSLVSHQERIVASRLATSTISATTGTPPSGYRFQVTPDF